jgi:hypothetical protein
MTDDNAPSAPNERPEQAKPEQTGQEVQQQTTKPDEPGQRPVPGRRPLFRN